MHGHIPPARGRRLCIRGRCGSGQIMRRNLSPDLSPKHMVILVLPRFRGQFLLGRVGLG